MVIHDITLTISPNLAVWPGDPSIDLQRVSKIEEGDYCNITRMSISVHTGTHVDAPYHFLQTGKTVESLSLNVLTGPAHVIFLPNSSMITSTDLESTSIPIGTKRLLIKTRNSELWAKPETEFNTQYVAIQDDAAEWLVSHGIALVGVDYLSVAPFEDSVQTHKILLSADVVIVEGLNLNSIEPGDYEIYCLPLKINQSDGAPARAILIEK